MREDKGKEPGPGNALPTILVALGGNVVDVILCDINRPVIDGLEFARHVGTVESAPEVDIVVLGHTPTAAPLEQAAAQPPTPAVFSAKIPPATRLRNRQRLSPPKPSVVRAADSRLQH